MMKTKLLLATLALSGALCAQAQQGKWVDLFDGKTLKGWKSTEFGGEGEVRVKDGVLYLEVGSDLTGITWQDPKKLPKTNYEITLEAMRVGEAVRLKIRRGEEELEIEVVPASRD